MSLCESSGEAPHVDAHGVAPSAGESAPTNTRATEHSNSVMLENHGELIDLNKFPFKLDIEITTNYVETREVCLRPICANRSCDASKIDFHIKNSDPKSKTIAGCKSRIDWGKWEHAIEVELYSLNKRKVFGPIDRTSHDVIPVGHE